MFQLTAQLSAFRLSRPLWLPFSLWVLRVLSGISMGILALAPAAHAAEKLVITYGPFNASLAVKDLETLVNTETVPGSLQFYLGLADLDPQMLRSLLSMELGASSEFMSDMLASESGSQLLSQMSQVIHLPPNRPQIQVLKSSDQRTTEPTEAENIEALRTALLDTTDDRRVTVLEVLQHYPTEKVYLDAVKLIRFANRLESEASSSAE